MNRIDAKALAKAIAIWTLLASSTMGIATEESFYYWAPIAVAVVFAILEVRAQKRTDGEFDDVKSRLRALEFGWFQHGNDVKLTNAINEKLWERCHERLDALEGTDTVPKETVENMGTQLATLKEAYGNFALAHHGHTQRLDALEADVPEAPSAERKRGRR